MLNFEIISVHGIAEYECPRFLKGIYACHTEKMQNGASVSF